MATSKQQDFGKLLEEYAPKLPPVGELINGNVVSVENGAVRIDINGIITGLVRGPELFAESSEYANISVGDAVEATVLEQENETGEMELSFRIAGKQRVWNRMHKLMEDGNAVKAKVLHANKGGLIVQVDAIPAFMPVSQLAPDNYPRVNGGDKARILEHLQQFVGQGMEVKIIDINEEDEKLIISEKAVWEDAQKAVLASYSIGDKVEGEVSALTSFGAFMKFGNGLEGLIHISEIVWQRIDHPKDVLKIGQKVEAQIIDLNKSKIYLSIKRLQDDPWRKVSEDFSVNEEVEGTIHKIESFGLMVKLNDHIHGLAHISELSNKQIRGVEELKEMFTIGDTQTFVILNIDPAKHRLGLRLKGVKGRERFSSRREEKKTDAAPEEETTEEADA